jgi:hypothetical protein
MIIDALVEGVTDEAVARKIVQATGHDFGVCYGKRGCGYIREKARLFNAATPHRPMLTLVDFMDTKAVCPPEVLYVWIPNRHVNMLFRVVVREIESWLLADRDNFSKFIGISQGRLPTAPEALDDPKRTVVNLARKSKYRYIRQAIVPSKDSSAQVGALYASEMIRFIGAHWDIQAARQLSPSLEKCMHRLEQLNT